MLFKKQKLDADRPVGKTEATLATLVREFVYILDDIALLQKFCCMLNKNCPKLPKDRF